eukprot:2154182-Rhodomonas_salina.1
MVSCSESCRVKRSGQMRNVDLQTLHPGSADFCVRRPRRVLPPLFFLAKLCTVLVFARNPLISMWYHRVGGYASGSYQDFTVFEFVVGIPIGNAITIRIPMHVRAWESRWGWQSKTHCRATKSYGESMLPGYGAQYHDLSRRTGQGCRRLGVGIVSESLLVSLLPLCGIPAPLLLDTALTQHGTKCVGVQHESRHQEEHFMRQDSRAGYAQSNSKWSCLLKKNGSGKGNWGRPGDEIGAPFVLDRADP